MTNKTLKAILVDVIDPETPKTEAIHRLEELESLVNTFGGVVIVKTIQKRSTPDYNTYIGSGKVSEIAQIGEEECADIVVINNLLKARQIYKLNESLNDSKMKVWDRVDLILKIFSKHAQSTEAKLQIELASIRHMGPRIFNMGIELSKQGGAMGMRAGQGESNTEMMKRHLTTQELALLKKLEHYDTINEGHRKRRRRQNFKTAAIVGYTNAGKSSLLNALTGKGAYVADQLFATLSTRVGKLYIEGGVSEDGKYVRGKEMLVSDTIGFIQDLPPDLIKAFKSTLSETVDADFLIHVIDATDKHVHKKIGVVEEILKQLGVDDKKQIYVFNKVDMISHPLARVERKIRKDEEEYLKRPGSLLKAGKETARILGWAGDEEEEHATLSKKRVDLTKLQKRYKKFNPVFVSAHSRINLEKLIIELEKNL